MRIFLLIIFGFMFCCCTTKQDATVWHTSATCIDSLEHFCEPINSDFLRPEFKDAALENVYFSGCTSRNTVRGHVYVIKLRSNATFLMEAFYTPYSGRRVALRVGTYRFSSDAIYFTYERLLSPKAIPGQMRVSPQLAVSWAFPPEPDYLSLHGKDLCEFIESRLAKGACYTLNGQSQFDVRNIK